MQRLSVFIACVCAAMLAVPVCTAQNIGCDMQKVAVFVAELEASAPEAVNKNK